MTEKQFNQQFIRILGIDGNFSDYFELRSRNMRDIKVQWLNYRAYCMAQKLVSSKEALTWKFPVKEKR